MFYPDEAACSYADDSHGNKAPYPPTQSTQANPLLRVESLARQPVPHEHSSCKNAERRPTWRGPIRPTFLSTLAAVETGDQLELPACGRKRIKVKAATGHHHGKMVMVIAARHNPCPHASGATHGFRPSSRQSPFWRSGRGRLTLSDRSAPARGATNPSGRGRTSGTGTPKPGANHKTTLLKRRSPYPALLESWQIPEVVRG